MASRSVVFALCLVAASTIVAGQDQGVFRVDTQTVPLYATVTDKAGRLIPYLEKEHFEVYDDGKLQQLTVFRSDIQPVSVVVMLDTSGSMTMNIELLKRAAEQFAIRLLPTDKAIIGSFSDSIFSSDVFTSNRDDLIRYLHTEIRFGNPTHLWDAIDYSMNKLTSEVSRRVVLIFTDGDDQKSVKTNFDQVLARAEAEGVMVYSIGLRSEFMGMLTRPDQRLRTLSASTGGGYFELQHTADLNSTFTRIADELHRQYVLGFKPALFDGKVHLVDVRVKVEGMTVRARKSYIAPKPGGGD
jgi:Ca-activated chloride channel family protein